MRRGESSTGETTTTLLLHPPPPPTPPIMIPIRAPSHTTALPTADCVRNSADDFGEEFTPLHGADVSEQTAANVWHVFVFLSRNARKVCCVIHKKTRKSTSAQSNLAKVRIATNSYGSPSNIRQINKKFCYRRRTARRAMSVKNSTQVVQQIYNKSK